MSDGSPSKFEIDSKLRYNAITLRTTVCLLSAECSKEIFYSCKTGILSESCGFSPPQHSDPSLALCVAKSRGMIGVMASSVLGPFSHRKFRSQRVANFLNDCGKFSNFRTGGQSCARLRFFEKDVPLGTES